MKLEKLLFHKCRMGRREARRVLGEGLVKVDGELETDPLRQVDEFTRLEVEGQLIQAVERCYYLVHKPAGYESSTVREQHPTVLELLPEASRSGLHYAGRLDLMSTGLMLLTNDGKWSRRLTEPESGCGKVYRVELESVVSSEVCVVLEKGIYLAYEDHTSLPCELEILDEKQVRIVLHEGKYHQIKRMFHAVGNRVVALHRERVGEIELDIEEGEWRSLSSQEIRSV